MKYTITILIVLLKLTFGYSQYSEPKERVKQCKKIKPVYPVWKEDVDSIKLTIVDGYDSIVVHQAVFEIEYLKELIVDSHDKPKQLQDGTWCLVGVDDKYYHYKKRKLKTASWVQHIWYEPKVIKLATKKLAENGRLTEINCN